MSRTDRLKGIVTDACKRHGVGSNIRNALIDIIDGVDSDANASEEREPEAERTGPGFTSPHSGSAP